jgi:autoinducer 2 (AI-2) kinase
MIEGIGFLSGLAMRWARDALAPDLVRRAAADPAGPSAYALMEEEATAIPTGSNGVLAVLSDVMQADAWHHAAPAIVGLDLGDPAGTGRAAVFRAIEEAAAYVARAHLDVLDELTSGATASGELVLAGGSGGAVLWPRIVAGATGRSVRVAPSAEATSIGAARLAAAAVGIELPALVDANSVPLAADPFDIAAYQGGYERWRAVYAAQRAATQASGLAPLFLPPGANRPSTPTPQELPHG